MQSQAPDSVPPCLELCHMRTIGIVKQKHEPIGFGIRGTVFLRNHTKNTSTPNIHIQELAVPHEARFGPQVPSTCLSHVERDVRLRVTHRSYHLPSLSFTPPTPLLPLSLPLPPSPHLLLSPLPPPPLTLPSLLLHHHRAFGSSESAFGDTRRQKLRGCHER